MQLKVLDKAIELDKKQGSLVDLGMEEFEGRLYYESCGVVAAIVPWNYPLLMATWKVRLGAFSQNLT